jgi:hypothetical protein
MPAEPVVFSDAELQGVRAIVRHAGGLVRAVAWAKTRMRPEMKPNASMRRLHDGIIELAARRRAVFQDLLTPRIENLTAEDIASLPPIERRALAERAWRKQLKE